MPHPTSPLVHRSLSSLALLTALASGCERGADPTVSDEALASLSEACSQQVDDAGTDAETAERELPAAAPDLERDVLATSLALDLAAKRATATIRVAPSQTPGLSFEIGDLTIESVTADGVPLAFTVVESAPGKRRLDVGVPTDLADPTLEIRYGFAAHAAFDGWMPESGLTFLWPYYCGNLYPCHSSPEDGSTFTMDVTGVPDGQTAVYPRSIPVDAPTYMPAIAIGAFDYVSLGATRHGTEVGYYVRKGNPAISATTGLVPGVSRMLPIFEWYETNVGPYQFGDHVASVEANWGAGAYGGMEHHPAWHVATDAFTALDVHAHEAAHGWYGDGVRPKCWEDFVLSEGTASYLAARAISVVRGPRAEEAIWTQYGQNLDQAIAAGDTQAWPQSCHAIDILQSKLWSNIPYMKGAFFYRAVAAQIGVENLDHILAGFYADHVGTAQSMGAMVARIEADSGQDVQPLVDAWLTGLGRPAL